MPCFCIVNSSNPSFLQRSTTQSSLQPDNLIDAAQQCTLEVIKHKGGSGALECHTMSHHIQHGDSLSAVVCSILQTHLHKCHQSQPINARPEPALNRCILALPLHSMTAIRWLCGDTHAESTTMLQFANNWRGSSPIHASHNHA